MITDAQLTVAVAKLLRRPTVNVLCSSIEPISAGTGRATGSLHGISGEAVTPGRMLPVPWRLVVKRLRRPTAPFEDDSNDPGHWSYWKREAIAYQSALLPQGEDGLRSVECLGVFVDDRGEAIDLVLAEMPARQNVAWALDAFVRAARHLGRWQVRWLGTLPQEGWLSRDQLHDRILRTDATGGLAEPDWGIPAMQRAFGPRRAQVRAVWNDRWALLERTASSVATLVHGDFSRGNLSFDDDGRVVVIDWATLGYGRPGFDLAHLVLSASRELWPQASFEQIDSTLFEAYLLAFEDASWWRSIRTSYVIAAMLMGVSRLCWTLRRTTDPAVVEYWSGLLDWLLAMSHEELN